MRIPRELIVALCCAPTVLGLDEPEGLLGRFLSHLKPDLEQVPAFVCSQTVERFSRSSPDDAWRRLDKLQFDVAEIGERELYALPGARRFDERPLVDLVGRGTISTGQFANFARHVFLTSTSTFTYAGAAEVDGRAAYEYKFDVSENRSSYSLHSGNAASRVAFQGSFFTDRENLDLIRLDLQAYDIPPQLGIDQADTSIGYGRITIGNRSVLLPVSARLAVVAADGAENLNRLRLSGCREYRVDAVVRFDDAPAAPATAGGAADRSVRSSEETILPAGAELELRLDSELNPRNSGVGDRITATLLRPLKRGDTVVAPEGTMVFGRIVRLDHETVPFSMHEIGLEFNEIEIDGRTIPLVASMTDAGPAPGLIHQKKRIDPTYTRRRTARMDILVREVQRGQGILHWEDRKGVLPRGLKMKWRIERSAAQ